jgi:G3E family GTPase
MSKATRIPFTVIGGFLGAGKTTLLNRWLRMSQGVRMAVLVNDFGALNIDAALIAGNRGDTVALTNGCVCCQIGDDLSMALIKVLETEPPFDAVVVEASGVSDPWRIAQLGRADPMLTLDGVIVLVDAGSIEAQARDPLLTDTLERQLKAADLVVVNKCELADEAARARLRTWIAAVAGPVPQFETSQADVPLPMLSSLAVTSAHGRHRGDAAGDPYRDPGRPHDHLHEHGDPAHGVLFDTWSARPAHAFDPEALRLWLKAVPAGVLRLKGIVRTTGRADWSEIQFAGRHGTLRGAIDAPQGGAAVVAIGLRGQLPFDALQQRFGSLD